MKFGTIPVDQAIGVILAHTLRRDGLTFKKGRTLGADDVARLKAAGLSHVIGARLGPGDIVEDDAAARIAARLAGANVRLTSNYTTNPPRSGAADG